MTPQAAQRYLDGLQVSGIKLGLENTRRALAALGDPHRALAFLHVAGTNGKGSVCAMLAEALRCAGLKSGLYTSPHLSDFGERIQVGGRPLPPRRLARLVSLVRRATRGIPLTYFEFATVMALAEFAEAGAEVAVLEVGMGGRLDATNAVTPLACVVTNVSREHSQYLGRTIREIAAEKAGIAKPGVPLITAASGPALAVIEARCAGVGAPLLRLGRDFRLRRSAAGLDYAGPRWRLRGLSLALPGRHQADNAALALAALEAAEPRLPRPLPEEALRRGLSEVRWPGRLECAGESPLLLLDGAHNPAAARALAAHLAGLGGKKILVVGVLRDKDAAGILRPLLPLAHRAVACAPREPERALGAEELAGVAARLGAAGVEVVPEVAAALRRALELAGPRDTVCVCGSLYVVGEARESLAAQVRVAAC